MLLNNVVVLYYTGLLLQSIHMDLFVVVGNQ